MSAQLFRSTGSHVRHNKEQYPISCVETDLSKPTIPPPTNLWQEERSKQPPKRFLLPHQARSIKVVIAN